MRRYEGFAGKLNWYSTAVYIIKKCIKFRVCDILASLKSRNELFVNMHAKKIVTSNRTVELTAGLMGRSAYSGLRQTEVDDVTKRWPKHKKCNTIKPFSLTFICESFSNTRKLERTVFSSKESGIQLSVKTTNVTIPCWYATAQSRNFSESDFAKQLTLICKFNTPTESRLT